MLYIHVHVHICTHIIQKIRGGGALAVYFWQEYSVYETNRKRLLTFLIFSWCYLILFIHHTFKHAEPHGTVCGSNFPIRCSWSGVFYMLCFIELGWWTFQASLKHWEYYFYTRNVYFTILKMLELIENNIKSSLIDQQISDNEWNSVNFGWWGIATTAC